MTKRIVCLAVALFMIFSFAACGDTFGLQRQINELKKENESLSGRIAGLEDETGLLSDGITELDNELNALTDKVSDLENELENLQKPGLLLTISLDKAYVYQDESFTLTATITNLTGISFYYYGSYERPIYWSIPNWKLGINEVSAELPMPQDWYFEKYSSKQKSFFIQTEWYDYEVDDGISEPGIIKGYQNPGEYEITAKARFCLKFGRDTEEYIDVVSNTVKIHVTAGFLD